MFKIILVPTDGSPLSDNAIRAAIELAQFGSGKIIGLSVYESYPFSALYEGAAMPEANLYDEQMRARAQENVQKIADLAQAANVLCETSTAQSFSPYEEIVKAAEKFHCDIIVMASHGRKGLNKLFLGSETQKVMAHTSLPVLVFR